MFTVKAQILGITSQVPVALSGPTTVAEIFRMAGHDIGSGNYTYKLNGTPIDGGAVVNDGGILVAAAQIKGN